MANRRLTRPTPEQVKRARDKARLSPPGAAAVVHLSHSIRWVEYERGKHRIPLASWELFLLRTGQRELELVQGEW